MLISSINKDWDNRQVDLSNDFFQDNLVEDFYLALPYYSDSGTGEDRAKMAMKLNKSLYGLVRAPLYWYNHLKGDF